MSAGQLLVLDCGMVHKVEALEESAFLLTVSWPKRPIVILMRGNVSSALMGILPPLKQAPRISICSASLKNPAHGV